MTNYRRELESIRHAKSLEEIQAVVRRYPVTAAGDGGILYSGPLGDVRSEVFVKKLVAKTVSDNG